MIRSTSDERDARQSRSSAAAGLSRDLMVTVTRHDTAPGVPSAQRSFTGNSKFENGGVFILAVVRFHPVSQIFSTKPVRTT